MRLPAACACAGLLVMSLGVRAQVPATAVNGPIAFATNRDGHYRIYVMSGDGSAPAALTNWTAGDWQPAWSPDGSRIAFRRNATSVGPGQIYVMNADGSGVAGLSAPAHNDEGPGWSPDGATLVFHSFRDGNGEVYVMNAAGGGEVNLTNHPADDYGASWSPDGAQIAFTSRRDGGLTQIYVMNANGTSPMRRVSASHDNNPAWSPGGAKIAFQRFIDGSHDIYVMNADGSNQLRLTNHASHEQAPKWSPDGTRIVFERAGEIYVMNADGTGQVNVTNHPSTDWTPAWGPAGVDSDGDGAPDSTDIDDDNDGIPDANDPFPLDPRQAQTIAFRQFVPTGSMADGRESMVIAPLPDGALVAGGYDETRWIAEAERFSASTGTFSPAGALPSTRSFIGHEVAVLADDRVMVTGGSHAGVMSPTASLYDPQAGQWAQAADMSVPRFGHTLTTLRDGRVLVAGGVAGAAGPYLKSAEVFDPASGQFSLVGEMAAARFGHTATLLADGRVLLAGGERNGALASAEIFDPETGTFAPAASMSRARFYHEATLLLDGTVLVTGGYNGGALTSAERYHPQSNTFSSAGTMAVARYTHAATRLPGGKVLVVGGSSVSTVAELYDGTSFLPVSGMMNAHFQQGAVLLSTGNVLVVGGLPVLRAAELFIPTERTFGDPDLPLSAIASSGLSVTFAATGACTVVGAMLNLTGPGTCTVTAEQAGNASYMPAYATQVYTIDADTDLDRTGDLIDPDDDNDGIADMIDTQPLVNSNDYRLDDATFGTIVDRSIWSLTLTTNVSSSNRVRAVVEGGIGVGALWIGACGGTSKQIRFDYNLVGESALWHCEPTGTLVVTNTGTHPVRIYEDLGSGFSLHAEIGSGDTASAGSPVTADPNNTAPVRVVIFDDSGTGVGGFSLDKGESVDVEVDSTGGDAQVQLTLESGEKVEVTLFDQSVALTPDNPAAEFQRDVPDVVPPVIGGLSADRSTLWPPNHQMVDVTLAYTFSDAVDPAPRCAVAVTSNEAVNGTGDGDAAPDWDVLDAHRLRLRAERAGTGNGRVYTVEVTCSDAAGNRSAARAFVTVPKSRGR